MMPSVFSSDNIVDCVQAHASEHPIEQEADLVNQLAQAGSLTFHETGDR